MNNFLEQAHTGGGKYSGKTENTEKSRTA